jgi:hypothetical protein
MFVDDLDGRWQRHSEESKPPETADKRFTGDSFGAVGRTG